MLTFCLDAGWSGGIGRRSRLKMGITHLGIIRHQSAQKRETQYSCGFHKTVYLRSRAPKRT